MQNLQIQDIAILLVEPSSTQQKIIARQLSELGINNVSIETTGEQALQKMASSTPDVVISALYLPDMTGTDLVHKIRETPSMEETGFILISSETRFRVLDPIRQAGVIAILPKPFGVGDLRVAMNNTLDYIDADTLNLETFNPEDLNVLIVDDSPLARKHIKRTLTGLGIENFAEATDGVEALKVLSDNYFDLVVTDYNMPNMDGKELVEHIRQESGQAAVPILMVTSENTESRLAAVQKSGVSAICDKPFESSSVRQLLEQMLS